jgi:serine/threonine protein kinase
MTDSLPLDAGTSIGGHYVIDALINRGGFGAVYRGIDTSEGNRPCAIKETYDVTPSARRQALMEGAVLFTIKSMHLPQVYDAFEVNGRFYLVMQLIEGETLQQLLKKQGSPCNEKEVLAWLLPIMHVLHEMHTRNPAVIHRDIKPGNIILTPNQTAVLVDFGLTKLYDPNVNTQTMVRAVSEGFSPVEQYVGKTSPQSDIYAMAATMYFLLTMRVPPTSINRSYRDELMAPRLLNPLLSLNIEQVLLKALAVNADQRYRTMEEFAQALQNPGFTAYADLTISEGSAGAAFPYTQGSNPKAQSQPSNMSGWSAPRPAPAPPPPPPPPAPARQPVHSQPSFYPASPVSHAAAPQPKTVEYRPLPSPFSQGCLWGLLQGILAALIVLFLKKEVYFYVAILEGFLFFLLAGFFTTRRGGGSSRGAWAGFWSGTISTIVFWIVVAVGFIVLVTRRVQADTTLARQSDINLNPNRELNHALQVVGSAFPTHLSTQAPGTSLIIFLVCGLLCAIGFGWLGGMLGNSRYKAKMQRSGYP